MSQVTDPKAELFFGGVNGGVSSAASGSLEVLAGLLLFGSVVFLVLS